MQLTVASELLHDCFSDDVQHFRETDFNIFSQMHTQGAAAAIGKNLEIPPGLRSLYDTKRVFRARDGQIVSVVARDL